MIESVALYCLVVIWEDLIVDDLGVLLWVMFVIEFWDGLVRLIVMYE